MKSGLLRTITLSFLLLILGGASVAQSPQDFVIAEVVTIHSKILGGSLDLYL